ncbi:MAG: endonuclease, partial [Elusimicrobiaceae bacterium]
FHSYSEARNFMYSTADNVLVSGKRGVIAAYSNIFIEGTSGNGGQYKENGDANGDGFVDSSGVNAEHSWPQSFFRQALPMRVDLHHLQTTLQTPNNKRSSLPYTMVNSYQYSTNAGSKLGALGFEPCNSDKGNTARAMLYFMMRYHDQNIRSGGYDNAFWKEKVDLFLLWNRQDPPDANEARRNELIFKYQGNRNPFIDNPSLADKIGAEVWKSL